jgi:hypothetical protein
LQDRRHLLDGGIEAEIDRFAEAETGIHLFSQVLLPQ